MFFRSDEIEEDLKCTYCRQKFIDVVKLIPSCGESICGGCYDELKANVDRNGEFKCKACEISHKFSEEGLPDNRSLSRMLRRTKYEKPLSEEAKTLKRRLESLPNQMRELKSFDDRDYINEYCDQLEVEIIEEIDSLVKLLNDIQDDLLKQAREYRKQCLDSLSTRISAHLVDQKNKKELEALSKEINEFNRDWHDFFSQMEANPSHKDIEAALILAEKYEEKMSALNRQLKRTALNGQVMEFKANHSFLSDPSPMRKFFCLSIQEDQKRELKIEPIPSRTLRGHTGEVNQVTFLSDNKLASCSDDTTIKVWNVENGALLYELKGHAAQVYSLALLMNGWLASGSDDKSIKLWDLDTRKEVRTLKCHTDSVASLHVLKNGNLASYSLDNTIQIWNPFATENNLLLTITGHGNVDFFIQLFGLLPNDNLVTISCDNGIRDECILRVWNSNDGSLVKSVPTELNDANSVLVLSNDQVAIGFENGTIMIIDLVDDSKFLTKTGVHDKGVDMLAQLSNGNLVSTGLHSDPDNHFESISAVKIWSRDGLDLLQTIKTDHSCEIVSAVFSTNGKLLATGSRDETIKLWSISSI